MSPFVLCVVVLVTLYLGLVTFTKQYVASRHGFWFRRRSEEASSLLARGWLYTQVLSHYLVGPFEVHAELIDLVDPEIWPCLSLFGAVLTVVLGIVGAIVGILIPGIQVDVAITAGLSIGIGITAVLLSMSYVYSYFCIATGKENW